MEPRNRPLDMEWLEDFQTLAETGNFSRAAEARAIAQPAFSRHIRSLEEWVGVELVDRTAHPVDLTDAGRCFLPLLNTIMAQLQAARIKAHVAHNQAAASLRLAATHTLSMDFFSRWLAVLEKNIRLGPVQAMSGTLRDCEDLMLQRRVQFMLCFAHAAVANRMDEGHYPRVCLGTDVLLPVSAPENTRPAQPPAPPGPAAARPLLGYSDQSGLGRILKSQLQGVFDGSSGDGVLQGEPVFTAHHAALLKSMALEGRGVAWLPRSLVAGELRSGALQECGAANWKIPLEIRLYRQPVAMAPVAEALWSACQGHPPLMHMGNPV